MTKKRLIEDLEIASDELNYSKWKDVLIDELDDQKRELFIRRKTAIEMYIDDFTSLSEIELLTGINRQDLNSLLKKCLMYDEHGEKYGFTALIPYKRLKSSTKDSKHRFTKLLSTYPSIEETLLKVIRDKKQFRSARTTLYLYELFLRACIDLGIEESDYPFNTEDKARRTFYRYINKLKREYVDNFSQAESTESYRKIKNSSMLSKPGEVIRPFERVQFDGHKIDGIFVVDIITPSGDRIIKTINRVWLLLIIDVATKLVLGYYISTNKEYTSLDVLKCIGDAIIPRRKIEFTIPGLKYPNDIGYHSMILPEAKWAVWDEFQYDNSKSNLAYLTTERLLKLVKCSINAGPIKTPERRSIIENLFNKLEQMGYHKLPNTTGSNILDPIRNEPEKNAMKYEITFSDLREITEAIIAHYNCISNSSNYGFSPIELMKQRIERGLTPRVLIDTDEFIETIYTINVKRKVQGSIHSGKRPFIVFEKVHYTNELLNSNFNMSGKYLILKVNVEDIRNITAYFQDGSQFGVLTAKGKWGITPHSLKTRRAINHLVSSNKMRIDQLENPIDIYLDYLYKNLNKDNTSKILDIHQNQNRITPVSESTNKKSTTKTRTYDNKSTLNEKKELLKSFKTLNC